MSRHVQLAEALEKAEEALLAALPYVEHDLDNPAYAEGVVETDRKKIQEAIQACEKELAELQLSDEIILRAGHYLYCGEYATEYEKHGGCFGMGAQIEQHVRKAPPGRLLPILRKYERKLAAAWKRPLPEVARLMGMDDENGQVDLFYYAMMQCAGHGIGLQDYRSENISKIEDALEEAFDPSPFHTEMTELSELAWELLETPYPEWVVLAEDGHVFEGKFHSQEDAETWLRDRGMSAKEKAKYRIEERKP
jgi:hypothetical protein